MPRYWLSRLPHPRVLAAALLVCCAAVAILLLRGHSPSPARAVAQAAAARARLAVGAAGKQEAVAGSPGAPAAASAKAAPIPIPRSTAKLLGQRIMVGVSGTSADPALLARVRAGRVGAVILFRFNITSDGQVRSLTGALQAAARQGHNPPLLIALDQEGGQVKRFASGPPDLSPPQMAATGNPGVAGSEGSKTGAYLKSRGVNWDLAPVVDVPTYPGAFIWTQGRAFSFNSKTVARFALRFALGLQGAHVAATAKHFPGVGSAAVDTDNQLDELHPTLAQRRAALDPYRALIRRGLDTIMLSTAGFPAYDRSGTPAALSREIVQHVLRRKLGFRGVTITDAPLGPPTSQDEIGAGVQAARAGADILLYTDSASGVLPELQKALNSRRLSRSEAEAAYTRIVALKRRVTG